MPDARPFRRIRPPDGGQVLGPGARPSPPPSAPGVAAEAPRPLPRRFVVLVIDDIHMGSRTCARIEKALTRSIHEDIGPKTRSGCDDSGAQGVSRRSRRTASSSATISRLTAKDRRADRLGSPLTHYQAELIERGDREALEAAVQEIRYED